MTASPIAYYGGKSETANSGTGRWIASLLPTDADAYIEPFAGFLGVLLQRHPSALEICNDANGHVVAFWRAVRDEPEALADRLWATPYSYLEWYEARSRLMGDVPRDDVLIAADVATLLSQGRMKAISPAKGNGWKRILDGRGHGQRPQSIKLPARIMAVAERIRNVQLECTDAVTLLMRRTLRDNTAAVIYADPPYRNADTSPYGPPTLNWEGFITALLCQQGRVAVSGYAGDMPELEARGWDVQYRDVQETASSAVGKRTEALWINYPTPQARLF